MKEEWLMPDAVVPIDAETTAALVAEIKRLIGVVGDLALRQALAQPEQEPSAKVKVINEDIWGIEWLDKPLPDDTPLYTAPPKREWVGLEDEDVATVPNEFNRGALWAEQILKEKNK